jgi:hypothetical protein
VKYWILAAFLALAAVFLSDAARAAGRCVAYGDESTDFTWHLCPAGEKYESLATKFMKDYRVV